MSDMSNSKYILAPRRKPLQAPDDIGGLIDWLGGPDPMERLAAQQVLLQRQAESTAPLLSTFRREAGRRRRRLLRIGGAIALAQLFALLLWLAGATGLLTPQLCCLILYGGLLLLACEVMPGELHRQTAGVLAWIDDLRVVGPLAEALALDDGYAQASAESALTRLLPRLQEADVDLLTDYQRLCLSRTLKRRCFTSREADFLVAVLQALGRVGDAGALPYVVSAARRGVRSFAEQRVRQAALDCLPQLQARIAHGVPARTLVRPSERAEKLVQPAVRVVADDQDRLVRPEEVQDVGTGHGESAP